MHTNSEKIVIIVIIFLILYLTSGSGTDGDYCNPIEAYGLGC